MYRAPTKQKKGRAEARRLQKRSEDTRRNSESKSPHAKAGYGAHANKKTKNRSEDRHYKGEERPG